MLLLSLLCSSSFLSSHLIYLCVFIFFPHHLLIPALDCGETFTSPTGTLSSPNYPSNYPNKRECVYKIVVGVNMQIKLNFTDFQLEYSATCNYDYVEIRSGV